MNIHKKNIIDTIQDKFLSTKKRGDTLEKYVKHWISQQFDINASDTKGSGSLHGDGDIIVDETLTIDCKIKGECKSISVPGKEIRKVEKQAAKMGRRGIIVSPVIDNNSENMKLYAVIQLEELIDLLLKEDTLTWISQKKA